MPMYNIRFDWLQLFTVQWFQFVQPGPKSKNSTFCPRNVFMSFVWISEQTAIIFLYNVNWLVFITDTECLLRGTDWVFKNKSSSYLSTHLHLHVALTRRKNGRSLGNFLKTMLYRKLGRIVQKILSIILSLLKD